MSLAIQLVSEVEKLRAFWESVQDAPRDVAYIKRDLNLLSSIIARTASQEQSCGRLDVTVTEALEMVHERVMALAAIVRELDPDPSSSNRTLRTWKAFKVTRKKARIQEFRQSVEEAKNTLLLACIPSQTFVAPGLV
jgi:hypothetical protein